MSLKEYEVSVHNLFEAESPQDAVEQMVAWLEESARVAGYRATWGRDKSDTVFVDAEDGSMYP